MPRPKAINPASQVKISLPASIVGELELLIFDDSRDKPTYGARSELFTRLLRYWLSAPKNLPELTARVEASTSTAELLNLALEVLDRSPAYNTLAASIRRKFSDSI